ncbi:hypothetical protein HPP92_006182 [Vanilla planifolia]|uniref:Uncharacterized protein n=1 Tax=Vanilla planifolia TaxID=51239 RepID=A0A835RJV6_VANPL|nr:hypothetical protein HPP92_006182 [Vanilla planifolia]
MALFVRALDGNEWEVCNDDGFIYKRRRRRRPLPEEAPQTDPTEELKRQQRSRKKRCLLAIREKYQREIEQWEELSAALLRLTAPTTTATGAGSAYHALVLPTPQCASTADDLLAQVEAQETAFRKVSDLCDLVDSFCEAREEAMIRSLFDLPIWGSPRKLMRSLCS